MGAERLLLISQWSSVKRQESVRGHSSRSSHVGPKAQARCVQVDSYLGMEA